MSGQARASGAAWPTQDRFHMPAEWEPHEATWLIWPHNRADWETKTNAVEWCYTEMVRHLMRGERVSLVYRSAMVRRRAERCLRLAGVDLDHVDVHVMPVDRSWIRDSGPIFLVRGPVKHREVAVSDWAFNGWARYRAWRRDNAVPRRIAMCLDMRRYPIRVAGPKGMHAVVLEGGSIDVNGCGQLLTTEECLLGQRQARNPGLTREEIEQALRKGLGVRNVRWLAQGIIGDDTRGHVDDIARFVGVNTIVVAVEYDRCDVNHDRLAENLTRLRSMRNERNQPFEVVVLPMPRPVIFDGERLPASYLNFYIANDVVLVPTFNDVADREALSILSELFPTREVIGIYAGDLILGLGALHCVTQQQPRGRCVSPQGRVND